MPLDHFFINVPAPKLESVVTFLTTSLEHLGFKEILRPVANLVGMGEIMPYFWIGIIDGGDEKTIDALLRKQHVAFKAETTDQVDAFHAAAMKAGGTCNGPPGIRPQYHPGYYGAYVRDPACGINFEVVIHKEGG